MQNIPSEQMGNISVRENNTAFVWGQPTIGLQVNYICYSIIV